MSVKAILLTVFVTIAGVRVGISIVDTSWKAVLPERTGTLFKL